MANERTALVADARPVVRDLVATILRDRGFDIAGEMPSLGEAMLTVQRRAPDAIVIHEDLVGPSSSGSLAQVRALAPNAHVVLLTREGKTPGLDVHPYVDEVMDETSALTRLGVATAEDPPVSEGAIAAIPREAETPAPHSKGRRWMERLQGAGIAAVFVLGLVLARTGTPEVPSATPRSEGASATGGTSGAERARSTRVATIDETTDATDEKHLPSPTTAGRSSPDPSGQPSPAPGPDPGSGPDPDPGSGPDPDPGSGPDPGPTPGPSPVPAPVPSTPSDPGPTTSLTESDEGALLGGAADIVDDVVDTTTGIVGGL